MEILSMKCELTNEMSFIMVLFLILAITSLLCLIWFFWIIDEINKKIIISIAICFIVGIGGALSIILTRDKFQETITQYYVSDETLIPVYTKEAYYCNYENKILTVYEKGAKHQINNEKSDNTNE